MVRRSLHCFVVSSAEIWEIPWDLITNWHRSNSVYLLHGCSTCSPPSLIRHCKPLKVRSITPEGRGIMRLVVTQQMEVFFVLRVLFLCCILHWSGGGWFINGNFLPMPFSPEIIISPTRVTYCVRSAGWSGSRDKDTFGSPIGYSHLGPL